MAFIKQLIKAAPFPENVRSQLLEEVDTFSAEKKFETEEACWDLISIQWKNDLRFKTQTAIFEMATGKKNYSKEDFKKIEDEMLDKLIQELNVSGDEEKVAEIKKQLELQSS